MKKENELFYNTLMKFSEDIIKVYNNFNDNHYLMYKFYTQSFKTYWVQDLIKESIKLLKDIEDELINNKDVSGLSKFLISICDKGTGKSFEIEHNNSWLEETENMMHAYLQCRYIVECIYRIISSTDINLDDNDDIWFIRNVYGLW